MKKALLLLLTTLFLTSCASTIHEAVKSRNMEKVKYFVEQGDVNTFNQKAEMTGYNSPSFEMVDKEKGHTPLMIASYYGYADIAKYLCEHGADMDMKNGNGETALILATYYNFPQVVKILVDHDVSVNQKDGYGHTALYYAEKYYYPPIMKELKAAGGIAE